MIDATAFLRLGALNSLGTTSTGASFATSTGDVLEVSCFGPGVFRVRAGPNTRPDYGLVTGRAKPCTVAQASHDTWTFEAGDATLELGGAPLAFRLSWKGKVVATSITDQHFRGFTRLPSFGRVRASPCWMASLALASGEPVYGLGEKFGPLDKRGQLVHSQVEDALGVNTGLSYKNTPFAWSPGTGGGAWGVFVNTPARVTHGVGHPDWSHRSYGIVVDDEALDLFLFAAATPAGIVDHYTQLTGRAPGVPRWSLGLWVSRAYYKTPEEAAEVAAKLRARKIPCDVLTLDGRAAWKVETRFNFRWDPDRFRDPRASLAAIKAHHLRVCVWEYPCVSVHDPLFAELAQRHYLLTTESGDPYVFGWDTNPATSPFGSVLTPLPESGIVDFTNPAAYAWWRDQHKGLFDDGVDAIKSDFGEQVPRDAVAFNGDHGARLHNVYPQLYNQCVYDATARFQAKNAGPPIVWSRAGWAASQRHPIGWGGDPQSDWEGLAASIRGGLSHGMSGNPYHSSDIGGFYGAAQPDAELYVRWLQATVFCSHIRVHGIGEREPWAFGPEAEAIVRKWLAFRYRLIPYLERVVVQATRTGLPVMRAMPFAFPGNPLVQRFETQFLCGDALLVAPIVAAGGEVDIALPPGAWYDLNTRARHAGRQVLRYRASLDQFPVFGREGHALPLGRAVQHTGEIDAANPLEQLWIFGAPANSLDGFTQARIEADGDGGFTLRTSPGVEVVRFGE
ncbi:MAG TPA: alpha-xylosidase [Casimicrobiaceae bacterium]|nr:alpha-xylosidase [Casimicrobiaceae bacterium]